MECLVAALFTVEVAIGSLIGNVLNCVEIFEETNYSIDIRSVAQEFLQLEHKLRNTTTTTKHVMLHCPL